MFWRLEQGPAAAIGLSLVIGIVMAEVLRKLGADKVRDSNGLMTSICRIASWQAFLWS